MGCGVAVGDGVFVRVCEIGVPNVSASEAGALVFVVRRQETKRDRAGMRRKVLSERSLYTKLRISTDRIKGLSPPVAYFILQQLFWQARRGGGRTRQGFGAKPCTVKKHALSPATVKKKQKRTKEECTKSERVVCTATYAFHMRRPGHSPIDQKHMERLMGLEISW